MKPKIWNGQLGSLDPLVFWQWCPDTTIKLREAVLKLREILGTLWGCAWVQCWFSTFLGGGFKYFLCSPLLGKDFQFDYNNIFQRGWFNHQSVLDTSRQFVYTPRKSNIEPQQKWVLCRCVFLLPIGAKLEGSEMLAQDSGRNSACVAGGVGGEESTITVTSSKNGNTPKWNIWNTRVPKWYQGVTVGLKRTILEQTWVLLNGWWRTFRRSGVNHHAWRLVFVTWEL